MRRREIKIIITEDWQPQTGEFPYDLGNCSTVGYIFNHNGEQYGRWLTINRVFLSDDEVVEAVSALIPSALEAIRELEDEDGESE